jgi:hypothetical protein
MELGSAGLLVFEVTPCEEVDALDPGRTRS